MNRLVTIPTERIGAEISAYTIGFAKLVVRDRIEDALGAGSGTLAKIGKVFGILTAAHVLDNLPSRGKVGIVQFQGGGIHYRKQTIEMEHTTKIVLQGEAFGPNGPDLGFLRLPPESIGWLAAINSFYNLGTHREDVQDPPPAPYSIDIITGMIDERTKHLPAEREFERRKGFEAILTNGVITSTRKENGFNLLEFLPAEYPDFKLPGDFQGTSGGALWRLYFELNGDTPKIVSKRFWGIPFFQSRAEGGGITLTSHAVSGVYDQLLKKITETWPTECAGSSPAAMFTNKFFDALGRWQRGWKQDPAKRRTIAAALLLEVDRLPSHFRRHNGTPLYRKRHLYRREDQRELVPLFLGGVLGEGTPTSWSKDYAFAQKFDEVFDQADPNSVAGAIFRHTPSNDEVVLNIPALWDDAAFVTAAQAYKVAGGAEAQSLFHFRGARDQNEIILHAPLRRDEIFALSGMGDFESLCATVGAVSDKDKDALHSLLQQANITPGAPWVLSDTGTQRVVEAVLQRWENRMAAWRALRVPTKPKGGRGRLHDAFELGTSAAATGASFIGWRKLSGPDGLMEARWNDGTVAYHRPDGAIWIW